MIVECLCHNRCHDVPRNIVNLQKIQEECYGRNREIETIEASIFGEYARFHKVMKSVASYL